MIREEDLKGVEVPIDITSRHDAWNSSRCSVHLIESVIRAVTILFRDVKSSYCMDDWNDSTYRDRCYIDLANSPYDSRIIAEMVVSSVDVNSFDWNVDTVEEIVHAAYSSFVTRNTLHGVEDAVVLWKEPFYPDGSES